MVDNLSDKSQLVFQEYLREILKRITDKEEIVQEASCSSFTIMISVKKEKIAPFLFDVFKVLKIYYIRSYQMCFQFIKELACLLCKIIY